MTYRSTEFSGRLWSCRAGWSDPGFGHQSPAAASGRAETNWKHQRRRDRGRREYNLFMLRIKNELQLGQRWDGTSNDVPQQTQTLCVVRTCSTHRLQVFTTNYYCKSDFSALLREPAIQRGRTLKWRALYSLHTSQASIAALVCLFGGMNSTSTALQPFVVFSLLGLQELTSHQWHPTRESYTSTRKAVNNHNLNSQILYSISDALWIGPHKTELHRHQRKSTNPPPIASSQATHILRTNEAYKRSFDHRPVTKTKKT